jgi:hypothetical protein
VTLYAWGNRHLAPEGASVVLVDAKSGALADPVLVDRNSGAPITAADFVFAAGPAANERIVKRLNASRALRGASGDIPVIAPLPSVKSAKPAKPAKPAAAGKAAKTKPAAQTPAARKPRN